MDLVTVVKGAAKKISIARPDAPAPGPRGWVVGQPMAVIRTNGEIDPRELRQLKVPVLTQAQTRQAVAVLDKQQKVFQEILKLQKDLKLLQVDAWQLLPGEQAAK